MVACTPPRDRPGGDGAGGGSARAECSATGQLAGVDDELDEFDEPVEPDEAVLDVPPLVDVLELVDVVELVDELLDELLLDEPEPRLSVL